MSFQILYLDVSKEYLARKHVLRTDLRTGKHIRKSELNEKRSCGSSKFNVIKYN